ncbi:DUF3298 domain-containing protein [Winogradskyella sp. PE311]|uniref:DUF3298 and DUF4163 domain-containing protein n=1 Tax=Winogradskyella sp. PE311 TaxID=3366943 RepID=UPI00397EE58D
MKRIILFSVIILLINSCSNEFKPVNFEITSIENSFESEISVIYDKASENDEISKKINFKIEETIISTLSFPEKKTNLRAVLEDFDTEYLKFKSDFPEESEPIWELHIETEKTYQSEDVITLAISTYEYKGGAHGNDKIKFLNLNAKTGDILNQKDILKNSKVFETIAKTYFLKNLENRDENLKMEDYFFGKPFQLPENIGFSDDGLVLLYNTYEVASYAQGYTEFVIPFDELEDQLIIN